MTAFKNKRLGFRAGAIGLLLAGLVACAPNPTPYISAAMNKGYGYAEQQIEQNRWRVSFTGNADTPRQQVENGLLYRAAQLTKTNGYDSFIVSTQETEPQTRYRSTFSGFDAGYGFYRHSWWGPGFDMSYGDSYPITNYTAYADVLMVRGKKDSNDVKAFNADDVMSKLGPTLFFGKAAQPPGTAH